MTEKPDFEALTQQARETLKGWEDDLRALIAP